MRLLLAVCWFLAGCQIIENGKDDITDWMEPEREPIVFTLSPATAPPNSTYLATLRAEENINWEDIEIKNIVPYGDVFVCDIELLYDEAILTLHIPKNAEYGTVDFLIEYEDGDIDMVENAVQISDANISLISADSSECEEE